jgi:dolichol-phosphate mannosyltransferase
MNSITKSIIVVPTYNEAANIEALMSAVAHTLPDIHMLVADDNSPDGTADIVERMRDQYPHFRVYRRTGPRGLGKTYIDAFGKVIGEGYDRILQMDADLSHNPSYLPALLEASKTSDVVIGSRYTPGGGVRDWPRKRVLLSKYANVYVRLITGVPTADATAGLRCWSRQALQAINIDTITSGGYSFQVEMIYRAHQRGLRISEVPIIFSDRVHGQSKMSKQVIMEAITMPWKLRLRSGTLTSDLIRDANAPQSKVQ